MLRILLLLEDYGEIIYLSTVLKKIGFDVEGIQNPRLFYETYLKMNPDIMILTAFGRRVKGLDLIRKKKPSRGWPQVIMLFVEGQDIEADPDVSFWLQSPIGVTDLLNTIGDLGSLDKNLLQEKFQKLRYEEELPDAARILKSKSEDVESVHVQGSAGRESSTQLIPTSMTATERRERFKKFLEEPAPAQHGYALNEVKEYVKNLRQTEKQPQEDDIDKERRALVEELFKKKP